MSSFDEINAWTGNVIKGVKPPPGFAPVPGSKVGLYRKRVGAEWQYWKPGQAVPGSKTSKDASGADAGSGILEDVRQTLIAFADKNGIDLHSYFGGDEKKFAGVALGIGMRLLTDAGVSTKDALDTLVGDGTFTRMANEVWERSRAKAAPAQKAAPESSPDPEANKVDFTPELPGEGWKVEYKAAYSDGSGLSFSGRHYNRRFAVSATPRLDGTLDVSAHGSVGSGHRSPREKALWAQTFKAAEKEAERLYRKLFPDGYTGE